MSQPIAFGHARWRVSILGVAGLCLGALLLHRTTDKSPLVIGYDWLDGSAEEIKSAIEKQWRSTRQM